MQPKDLPGFFFDPEKNRYFPIKGPIPGGSTKRPPPTPPPQNADQGCHDCRTQRRKRAKAAELVHMRELHGRVLSFNKQRHSFEQVCQDMQASYPMVWKYRSRGGSADRALEQFHAVIQTPEGQKETNILSMGSMSGSISFHEVGKVGLDLEYGSHEMPVNVWPRNIEKVGSNILPTSLWSSTEASTNFPSSVSSIKKIGKRSLDPAEDSSPLQNGLVSTLGNGRSGGSVYVIDLSGTLDFNSTASHLQRRILQIASFDCTLWTADCSPTGTQVAVGTNQGAALVNLETGSLSWIYRSKSDIFSQQFDYSGNIVLCGFRNGSIVPVDIRLKQQRHIELSARPPRHVIQSTTNILREQASHGKKLSNPGIKLKGHSSCSNVTYMPSAVCSLVSLLSDDHYFLGSSMDGNIRLFDRRLLQRAVQSYEGHCNSHTHLQLGVNPSETHFISGGEDCYVRVWNIKTTKLLFSERVSNSILETVCWPRNGLEESDKRQCFGRSQYEIDHSWGAWLGSREGVHYIHGT